MSANDQMADKIERCPAPLQEIIEDFRDAPPRERLEYLLEFSMELWDLTPEMEQARDSMEQVHECQTPVFLHTEYEDGRVRFLIDVPEESPTVRGYAAILQQGFQGTTPRQVLDAPDDIYMLLGLQEAISPLRLRGLHALMSHIKRQVQRLP